MNNKTTEKVIFKAVYKKKYIGFFFPLKESRFEVTNVIDPDDKEIVESNECNIYRCTGSISKNKGLLFENDIVTDRNGDLAVILYHDCRFIVQYLGMEKKINLSDNFARRCILQGDFETDVDILTDGRTSESYEGKSYSPVSSTRIKNT